MARKASSSHHKMKKAQEIEIREPPSDQLTTNLASPNSSKQQQQLLSPPPRTSTSSSASCCIQSDSEYSYSGYSSSADYSSNGSAVSQNNPTTTLHKSSSISKKKTLLKSSSFSAYHGGAAAADNTDFGHGLLSQVHKMQSLLEEYQNSLTALEIEKVDNQQEMNKLDKRLKAKGETEERYKEEIWDLELTKQELLQKINDLTQNLQKSSFEQSRLEREQIIMGQELEQLKAVQHSWEQQIKEAQENHELETISYKKLLHSNRIEKESLSRQIQELVAAQQAGAMAAPTLRHVENEKGNDDQHDTMEDMVSSLPSLMATSTNTNSRRNSGMNNNNAEIHALKSSLNQAHEIIQTMQEKIDKERDERMEVDKLLREAQETIEHFHTNSQNGSAQWYPQQQSLALSANSNNLLSPTSPTFSIQSTGSNNYHHRRSSRRSSSETAAAYNSKSCRKRFMINPARSPYPVHRGKSLCDELSQAASIVTFSGIVGPESPVDIRVINDDQDEDVLMEVGEVVSISPQSHHSNGSSGSMHFIASDIKQSEEISREERSISRSSPIATETTQKNQQILTDNSISAASTRSEDLPISAAESTRNTQPIVERSLNTATPASHNNIRNATVNETQQKEVEWVTSISQSPHPLETSEELVDKSRRMYVEDNEEIKETIFSPNSKSPPIELTFIDLPAISNHEMYSSFTSSSNLSSNKSGEEGEEDNYNEEIKVVVQQQQQQQQQQNYGSLLKKESYIYKSRRALEDERKKKQEALSSSTLIESNATESVISRKIEKVGGEKRRESNDDVSMAALTRTMIGDWMWKYTRKVVGSGISENRHRRFFWIHPYTQTLYWSSQEPGSNASQSTTKSALVESFVLLDDGHNNKREKSKPPSILIKTPSRVLKVQCVDINAHHVWIKSLKFLLADNNESSKQQQQQQTQKQSPKLSRLGSISKYHYLNRKKSRLQQKQQSSNENNTISLSSILPLPIIPDNELLLSPPQPPPASNIMLNNSTLVDLSNTTNSNVIAIN